MSGLKRKHEASTRCMGEESCCGRETKRRKKSEGGRLCQERDACTLSSSTMSSSKASGAVCCVCFEQKTQIYVRLHPDANETKFDSHQMCWTCYDTFRNVQLQSSRDSKLGPIRLNKMKMKCPLCREDIPLKMNQKAMYVQRADEVKNETKKEGIDGKTIDETTSSFSCPVCSLDCMTPSQLLMHVEPCRWKHIPCMFNPQACSFSMELAKCTRGSRATRWNMEEKEQIDTCLWNQIVEADRIHYRTCRIDECIHIKDLALQSLSVFYTYWKDYLEPDQRWSIVQSIELHNSMKKIHRLLKRLCECSNSSVFDHFLKTQNDETDKIQEANWNDVYLFLHRYLYTFLGDVSNNPLDQLVVAKSTQTKCQQSQEIQQLCDKLYELIHQLHLLLKSYCFLPSSSATVSSSSPILKSNVI